MVREFKLPSSMKAIDKQNSIDYLVLQQQSSSWSSLAKASCLKGSSKCWGWDGPLNERKVCRFINVMQINDICDKL